MKKNVIRICVVFFMSINLASANQCFEIAENSCPAGWDKMGSGSIKYASSGMLIQRNVNSVPSTERVIKHYDAEPVIFQVRNCANKAIEKNYYYLGGSSLASISGNNIRVTLSQKGHELIQKYNAIKTFTISSPMIDCVGRDLYHKKIEEMKRLHQHEYTYSINGHGKFAETKVGPDNKGQMTSAFTIWGMPSNAQAYNIYDFNVFTKVHSVRSHTFGRDEVIKKPGIAGRTIYVTKSTSSRASEMSDQETFPGSVCCK